MVNSITDIDIDFADREQILKIVPHIKASRLDDGDLVKHNVGVYFQELPVDPITGLSSIPYEEAEERGYFKFDFLNVNGYDLGKVRDEEHLQDLVEKEPEWDLLRYQEITDTLFQLGGDDNYRLLQLQRPKSIEQLSMTLALQRPAKRYLVGKPWDEIEQKIWKTDGDSYAFKKSHATAYAIAIVVQMNLLMEQMSND